MKPNRHALADKKSGGLFRIGKSILYSPLLTSQQTLHGRSRALDTQLVSRKQSHRLPRPAIMPQRQPICAGWLGQQGDEHPHLCVTQTWLSTRLSRCLDSRRAVYLQNPLPARNARLGHADGLSHDRAWHAGVQQPNGFLPALRALGIGQRKVRLYPRHTLRFYGRKYVHAQPAGQRSLTVDDCVPRLVATSTTVDECVRALQSDTLTYNLLSQWQLIGWVERDSVVQRQHEIDVEQQVSRSGPYNQFAYAKAQCWSAWPMAGQVSDHKARHKQRTDQRSPRANAIAEQTNEAMKVFGHRPAAVSGSDTECADGC